MQRVLVSIVALVASFLPASVASASDSCKQLNAPAQADDLLTVTMKSISVVEKTGSFQLTIIYEQKNNTSDKKIDEGQFKLFFTDGTSTPQYGFFGSFFPGDLRERSYTWEYLKSVTPMVISYNAGFFATEPSSYKLNWAPPGQTCVLVSQAVKAKQEAEARAAAEKAAAELKAKQEAEVKAAAELKAKQEAEARAAAEKAAAELKAKQEAEARAAAEKAAAELKAKQEAEAKAAAEKTLCEANRIQLLSVQNSLLIAIKSYPKSSTSLSDTAIRLSNALSSACISIVTLSDFRAEVAVAISQAKAMATRKTTTITCVKGKLTKKVTSVNPKCPAGYTKRK